MVLSNGTLDVEFSQYSSHFLSSHHCVTFHHVQFKETWAPVGYH